MKFRVKVACTKADCLNETEAWAPGTRQYVSGEWGGRHTDLWEIEECQVELPDGWTRNWDQHYREYYFACPEHS